MSNLNVSQEIQDLIKSVNENTDFPTDMIEFCQKAIDANKQSSFIYNQNTLASISDPELYKVVIDLFNELCALRFVNIHLKQSNETNVKLRQEIDLLKNEINALKKKSS